MVDTYPDVDRALATAGLGTADADALAQVGALTRVSSGHAIRELSRRTGVAEAQLRAAYDGVKELWGQRPAPVMAGAQRVMSAVTAGGGLNLVATHRDRASAEQLLAATGLAVDDMVCAPDGFARKPAPDLIVELLHRHDLAPAEALAVDDRALDVHAAGAAGVVGLLLVTGVTADTGSLPQIDELTDLLPLLAR